MSGGSRSAPRIGWTLLRPAALVGALLLAVGFGLRSLRPGGNAHVEANLTLLFGAAAVCSAVLLRRRSASLAWTAAVSGAGLATLEILGDVRAWLPLTDLGGDRALIVLGEGSLLAAAAIAAAAVSRRRDGQSLAMDRLAAAWAAIGGAGLLVLALGTVVASIAGEDALLGDPEGWPLRLSARAGVGFLALSAVVAAARDLAGPMGRARARSGASEGAGRSERLRTFALFLGEELLPTPRSDQRRAIREERARIAADLHARVLPDLRRAVAEAELAGVPAVAGGLRDTMADVQQLIEARESVVLEEFGLVAALEWLAERAQARGPATVSIDLEGELVGDRSAVAPETARALFRIALLAADNAVRHAAAEAIVVRLSVDDGGGRLAITDDGHGFEVTDARLSSGRGLADMRSEATAIGAVLKISAAGTGTRVEVAWSGPAIAEQHATDAEPFATGPRPSRA